MSNNSYFFSQYSLAISSKTKTTLLVTPTIEIVNNQISKQQWSTYDQYYHTILHLLMPLNFNLVYCDVMNELNFKFWIHSWALCIKREHYFRRQFLTNILCTGRRSMLVGFTRLHRPIRKRQFRVQDTVTLRLFYVTYNHFNWTTHIIYHLYSFRFL